MQFLLLIDLKTAIINLKIIQLMKQIPNGKLFNQNMADNVQNEVGSWNNSENLRYAVFLIQNRGLYSRKKRSNQDFFKQMSKNIKTRTSVQCRCHHQKVFQKFKSLQKIICHYQSVFRSKNLEAYLADLQQKSQIEQKIQNIFDQLEVNDVKQEKISLPNNFNIQSPQINVIEANPYPHMYQNMGMTYPTFELPHPFFWANNNNGCSYYFY